MSEIIGTVFSVTRCTSTTSNDVGDFNTFDEAKAQMVKHFQSNAKRGNISYTISENQLENCNGAIFRLFTVNLSGNGKRAIYKKYSRSELETMNA